MAQPSAADLFVNLPLTTLSVAYMQQASDFVATQVFPVIPSDLPGHTYFIWNRDDWYRIGAQFRADGAESAGSGIELSQDQFFCKPYAIHKDITDQTLATQIAPLNIEMTSTRWVTMQLMLKRESLWMNSFFKTGVWGTDITGVASGPTGNQTVKWSVAGSTPVEDVDTQIWKMKQATGYKPNIAVLSPDLFTALKNHAEFLDRIKYTQTGIITEDLLATVWGLDKVVIASVTAATSPELANSLGTGAVGVAMPTATYAFLTGVGQMLLAYSAPEPGLDTPSAGYTFAWTGYTGAGAEGNRIKSFRIEEREATRIEGTLAIDPHIVAPDLGIFFTSII